MATYNGEKHIREQLDSIACQELLPLELVITDDGSTDATLQIVDDFARDAPFPIKVYRNETRLGYADNFLKAASLCEGDLIAFCDQDDIWMEKKLRVCSEIFRDPRILLAVHSAQTIMPSGELGSCYPYFSVNTLLDQNSCDPFANRPGFAMVFKRKILHFLDNHVRPDRVHSHDRWLWFLAYGFGGIATISEVLTLYRQHETNVCGAPRVHPLDVRAKSIARTLDYEGLADSELACAQVLLSAAERHADRAELLTRSAERLELRSNLHRIRARIYRRESTLLSRAMAFAQILFHAGYRPDPSGTRLGFRAATKDMVFGVPGAYKWLPDDSSRKL